jgi:hypothetical protein
VFQLPAEARVNGCRLQWWQPTYAGATSATFDGWVRLGTPILFACWTACAFVGFLVDGGGVMCTRSVLLGDLWLISSFHNRLAHGRHLHWTCFKYPAIDSLV